MKILNGYCGIGGNRKLWTPNGNDHEITAIEKNQDIAGIYQDFFPNDNVIVTDAHQYLLEHYKEFDFIFMSPPCPTHSDIRRCGVHGNQCKALYPDMKLYQEIILLNNFMPKGKFFAVENVKPYYDYLIEPNIILSRHPFWNNFNINHKDFHDKRKHKDIKSSSTIYGFNIEKYKISGDYDKRKILRNLVNPELGLHILNQALNIKTDDDRFLFD